MNKKRIAGLYLLLDQQHTERDILSVAIEAVEAGVDIIQYREKTLPKKNALTVAIKLRNITNVAGVIFIVNDDPALTLEAQADGVHLGQGDISVSVARKILGKHKLVGISTHSYEEALKANQLGVDYIGLGPIFHSKTKMVTSPLGVDVIKEVRSQVSVPVIAIGGIDQKNAIDVIKAGADGVAVISAILSAPDIKKAVSDFKERLR